MEVFTCYFNLISKHIYLVAMKITGNTENRSSPSLRKKNIIENKQINYIEIKKNNEDFQLFFKQLNSFTL